MPSLTLPLGFGTLVLVSRHCSKTRLVTKTPQSVIKRCSLMLTEIRARALARRHSLTTLVEATTWLSGLEHSLPTRLAAETPVWDIEHCPSMIQVVTTQLLDGTPSITTGVALVIIQPSVLKLFFII